MRKGSIRPIDATALFWGFVVILVAAFFWLTGDFQYARYCCVGAFLFALWQIYTWCLDAKTAREADEWCHKHYPSLGDLRLHSFINSIGRDAGGKLCNIQPDSTISELDWITNTGDGNIDDPGTPHKHWLDMVLDDACIQGIDSTDLEGRTLGDIIDRIIGPTVA